MGLGIGMKGSPGPAGAEATHPARRRFAPEADFPPASYFGLQKAATVARAELKLAKSLGNRMKDKVPG